MLEKFMNQAKMMLANSKNAKRSLVTALVGVAGLSILSGCVAVPYDGDGYYNTTTDYNERVVYGAPVVYGGYNGYWINDYYYPAVRVYLNGGHHWKPSHRPVFHRHHEHAKPYRLHNGGPDWRDFRRPDGDRFDNHRPDGDRFDGRRPEPSNDYRRRPPSMPPERQQPAQVNPWGRPPERQHFQQQERHEIFEQRRTSPQMQQRRESPNFEQQRRPAFERPAEMRREIPQQREFRREAPQQQPPQQGQGFPQRGRDHQPQGQQGPAQGGPPGMR